MSMYFKEANFQEIKELTYFPDISEKQLLNVAKHGLSNSHLLNVIDREELFANESLMLELRNIMDIYSLFEIAFVADFIAVPSDEEEFVTQIMRVMGEGVVKNYCFEEYNSILPLNLAQRLEQGMDYVSNETISSINLPPFYEFINSYQYLQNNSNLYALFVSGLSHVKAESLLKPTNWITYLKGNVKNWELKNVFNGILAYVDYTNIIYTLFRNCEDVGALESAIISYHAKNFNINNTNVADIQVIIPQIAKNCRTFAIERGIKEHLSLMTGNEAYEFQEKIDYIQERIGANIGMSLEV